MTKPAAMNVKEKISPVRAGREPSVKGLWRISARGPSILVDHVTDVAGVLQPFGELLENGVAE